MSKFHNVPIFDEATLQRFDEEDRNRPRTELDTLTAPQIDPKSDPFGMGYEWLNEPMARTIDDAYVAFVKQPAISWHRKVGADFRRIALSGSLATGSNADLFKKWSHDTFGALCESQGDRGEELLATLRTSPERSFELVKRVVDVIVTDASFKALSPESQVAAALIVIDAFTEQLI